MKLSLYPYQLQFKFPFRIAHGVRTHTDVVYVKLEHETFTAWGEAALPPYLPETQKSVIDFLTGFSKNLPSNSVADWFEKLSKVQTNMSAKAALDMALWSLKSQTENRTIGELLGINSENFPEGYYTIGICSAEEMKERFDYALQNGFERFKLKLDGKNDFETVKNFASHCNKPFAADVNSGWKSIAQAKEFVDFIQEYQCAAIEQPFEKHWLEEMQELRAATIMDFFADESCHRLSDIEKLKDSFDGINIKLMKCGGITEAIQMIKKARELGLKVLIGCMSESSVGCTAAAHLTPLADYADLDGSYLISNDPFTGMKIVDGRVKIFPLEKTAEILG